ncbi:YHYH protein [Tumidithrix helvetica PCC 7403]|uniref:YHYH protein n=1 Tax=Tumidithrix helvetica TaxID=3457545 RepID=UPI003C84A6B3
MKKHFFGLAIAVILLILAFHKLGAASSVTLHANPTPQPALVAQSDRVDLTHLPLGDGKLSRSPKVGWIWPCRIEAVAGGAFRDGTWIKKDGTYDLTSKAVVDGAVTWPSRFKMTVQGDKRVFATNDLPNHPTGTYPISRNDDAYQFDRNPNSIAAQNMRVDLPVNPQLAAQPSCTPGAVGILLTGSVLFNALDAPGRDAVAHETQDSCQGHPQVSGVYHYHSLTTCFPDATLNNGHSTLVGYSLDGFGIYGRRGQNGKMLMSADLDECHGHTHAIDWDGKQVSMYHYHATWDFPYTVGCMRGKYNMRDVMTISGPPPGGMMGRPPNGRPPMHHPDLQVAAQKLGISAQTLREALGSPPPDLAASARRLGISEQALRDALGVP